MSGDEIELAKRMFIGAVMATDREFESEGEVVRTIVLDGLSESETAELALRCLRAAEIFMGEASEQS
jgi:hypothetical protein